MAVKGEKRWRPRATSDKDIVDPHESGHGEDRRDDSPVFALGDQLQGLPPVEIRVRAAEPQPSWFVPKNGAEQVDNGLQLEESIPGTGLSPTHEAEVAAAIAAGLNSLG